MGRAETMEAVNSATGGAVGGEQEDLLAAIRLAFVPGIGPKTVLRLLERFGSPRGVLAATADELATADGLGPKLVHALRTAAHHVPAESMLQWCQQVSAAILQLHGEGYPSRLYDLGAPPPILFVQGEIAPADELAVAIVGTRHATRYGLRQAERFAYGLAKAGVTVISGLARGIDAACHEGALGAGGRTIAVLGSGLGHIYPKEHQSLAASVRQSGAVLSEYAPDAKPRAGMFPQRNRLISGLSLATLVIEAPERSGSLITARLAGEQGREVLALPGAVNSRASRGCNQLIRDGATLVQSVEDVLESLGPIREAVQGVYELFWRLVSLAPARPKCGLDVRPVEDRYPRLAIVGAVDGDFGHPLAHVVALDQFERHALVRGSDYVLP